MKTITIQIKASENNGVFDATLIVNCLGICDLGSSKAISLAPFPLIFLFESEYSFVDFIRAELFISQSSSLNTKNAKLCLDYLAEGEKQDLIFDVYLLDEPTH